MAKSCASGTCNSGLAGGYAKPTRRTSPRARRRWTCCGYRKPGGGLCKPPSHMPANPAAGTNYVDVRTSTGTPGGLLPPVFARTLVGNSGYSGTNVKACAQAEWGPPKTASTIAFTVSACEWDQATNQGATFAPPPPYPPNPLPALSLDRVFKIHTTNSNSACPIEPAGADAPGNSAGPMTPATARRASATTATAAIPARPPARTARRRCKRPGQQDLDLHPRLHQGHRQRHECDLHPEGLRRVRDHRLPPAGLQPVGLAEPEERLQGSDFCINGYFTQGLVPSSGSVGGTILGASIIVLSG